MIKYKNISAAGSFAALFALVKIFTENVSKMTV
jgi:hypothetical protein